jgi:hypothetical protein
MSLLKLIPDNDLQSFFPVHHGDQRALGGRQVHDDGAGDTICPQGIK